MSCLLLLSSTRGVKITVESQRECNASNIVKGKDEYRYRYSVGTAWVQRGYSVGQDRGTAGTAGTECREVKRVGGRGAHF